MQYLYSTKTPMVRSPDGDTECFEIKAGVLQGDTLAPYLFIICLDYVLRTAIDPLKEYGFTLKKRQSRRYPATFITDADYADDLALLSDTTEGASKLLHALEKAASNIGLQINVNKTEHMNINCQGSIRTNSGALLKSVDQFTYLGSNISTSAKEIGIRIGKAWSAMKRLSVIWKSNIRNDLKKRFFQTTVESVLLYASSTWTLTKQLEKTLNGNYTKMLRAVLNVSWKDHPTNAQLYGKLKKITDVIKERRLRFAGHTFRQKEELASDLLLWAPNHGTRNIGRPYKTCVDQLIEDSGHTIEELPTAMMYRLDWKNVGNRVRASSSQ